MNNGQQAPPPAYGLQRPINTLTRVQPRSLRIVILCFTLCGCIWATVWGVRDLKDLNDEGETSSMKVFDTITGIIYLVIAAIELGGFLAALKNTARLVRIYAFLSIGSIILAAAGGIIQVIRHFALKAAIKSKCVTESTGTFESSSYWGSSSTFTYTEGEAITYCDKLFSRNTWYYIIWLFAAVFFASMASLFTFAFARQLANPSAYPTAGGGLRPPSHDQGMPLQQYQSRLPEDYVPPYPGPPPNQPSPYDSDLKSPNQPTSFIPVSAEDEAWNRSLAESERREWEQHEANQRQGQNRGVVVGGNEAEDEAWEEARRGAGTANVGGGGGGGGGNPFADSRRRGDGVEDQGGRV